MLSGILKSVRTCGKPDKEQCVLLRSSEPVHQSILQHTGFLKGSLPFKYLGVPLSSKKITVSQCQPLLDKILGRINTWTVKYVSYAGRLQLVQSVLISIQAFWSQIFLLPRCYSKLNLYARGFCGLETHKIKEKPHSMGCNMQTKSSRWAECNGHTGMEQSWHYQTHVEPGKQERQTMDSLGAHLLYKKQEYLGSSS